MRETIEDTLNGVLDDMETDDIIVVWNEYCTRANYMDDTIFRNDPSFFMDNYSEDSMWSLVKHISHGNYNSNDNYVVYSKQTGNLNSFDYLCDTYCPYDQSSLVNWLIRTYGDDLESIGEFLGEDIEVEEDDTIYNVGDKTYQFCADDDLVCCCDKCCFRQGKNCGASDLYDCGALPQCDGDGIGYNGYWIEVKND
jgi:hypothetical protein